MKTLQDKIDNLRETLIEAITHKVKAMGGEVSLGGLDYYMTDTGFYKMDQAIVSDNSDNTDYLYIITYPCDALGSYDEKYLSPEPAEEFSLNELYDIAAILDILDTYFVHEKN